MMHRDLPVEVLARKAIVYVRQSTGIQVQEEPRKQAEAVRARVARANVRPRRCSRDRR